MVKELRGESCYHMQSLPSDKKSICTSRTFGNMVNNLKDLSSSIAMYTTRCAEKLRSQNSYAHFAHVFIMTNPFRNNTAQYSKNKLIKFIQNEKDLGFVPTMGAIHRGHISLFKRSISSWWFSW